VTNGLLLRADIHTLFDIGLIAIDEGFKVLISPNLDRTEYSALRGQVLSIRKIPRPGHLSRLYSGTESRRDFDSGRASRAQSPGEDRI